MAQNGGPGRGQGRKKGGSNQRTLALRAIADEALKSGCSPLEVLLDNMRFYQSKIKMAEQMLADAIANKETPAALIAVLQKLCNFRSEAGRFAVEAAPYVHAKLASITVGGDPENPIQFEDVSSARDKLAHLYQRPDVEDEQRTVN